MKRACLICGSIGLLTLVSCDRQQVATAILTVGFSQGGAEVVENDWQAGLLPREQGEHGKLDEEFGEVMTDTPLDRTWSDLQELRSRIQSSGSVDVDSIEALVARSDALIAESEQNGSSRKQLQSARDAKLTALTIGASTHPSLYLDRRDSFYREVFQAEYDGQMAAHASVKQFVTDHLSRTETDPQMTAALARHVTAHPDCEMNVQLYMTTVERLANEDQPAAAVKVAAQGLKLCAASSDVSRLNEQMRTLQAANPDSPGCIMQFTSPTLRGGRFDLRSMRGKPVLVVFWATWCPSCVKETPRIKEFYQRYRDDGLEVVGVSLDADREMLADYVNQHQLPWPQMFSNHPGNEAWNNPIARHFHIDSIPRAFLVDENGAIVAAHLRGQYEIEDAILNLLSR